MHLSISSRVLATPPHFGNHILDRVQEHPIVKLIPAPGGEGLYKAMQVHMIHRIEGWQMEAEPVHFIRLIIVLAYAIEHLLAEQPHPIQLLGRLHFQGVPDVLLGADEHVLLG